MSTDISDEQIDAAWDNLPGIQIHNKANAQGLSTNVALHRAFARAILALAAQPEVTAAREPVGLSWPKIESIVDDFIEGYEMLGEAEDGRDACYTPDEGDRALLRDCIAGLLAEPEFLAALADPSSPRAASPEGWQPIETAPKDGTLIVLGAKNGVWLGKYLPVYGSGYKPENPWSSMLLNHDHMAERYTRPTRWMPLPVAPGASPDHIADAGKMGARVAPAETPS